MKIKHIQSQILINRHILCDMYQHLQYLKQGKRAADEAGKEEVEYAYHNELKKHRKAIASMVALQQALKQDRAEELSFQRTMREIDSYDQEDFLSCAELELDE